MPGLVLRTSAILDAMRIAREAYSVGATDSYLQRLSQAARSSASSSCWWVWPGSVCSSVRGAHDRLLIAYLVFAIPTVAVLLPSVFQPVRNLVPLIPFLVIAAATAVVNVVGFVGARLHLPRSVQSAGAVAIVLVLCWSPFQAGTRPYIDVYRALTDTRVTVRRWIETHVHAGDRVLVATELAFLPDELNLNLRGCRRAITTAPGCDGPLRLGDPR